MKMFQWQRDLWEWKVLRREFKAGHARQQPSNCPGLYPGKTFVVASFVCNVEKLVWQQEFQAEGRASSTIDRSIDQQLIDRSITDKEEEWGKNSLTELGAE